MIQRLNHTFVTPQDREDIHELAPALDDIVDYTDGVADYLGGYKIEAPIEQAHELAVVLARAARPGGAGALGRLHGFKDITQDTVEVPHLENEGIACRRHGVARPGPATCREARLRRGLGLSGTPAQSPYHESAANEA